MKPYPKILTIGIAARNEEKTIKSCLKSIARSCEDFPMSTNIEIIVVLNGCVDKTELVVWEYINSYVGREILFFVHHAAEGQINAQRKIWESKIGNEVVIFIDADTIVEKNCICQLVETFLSEDQLEIVWAKCLPYRTPKRFAERIYNFFDYYPEMRKKQNYFTGKAFAVRNFDIPNIGKANRNSYFSRMSDYLHLDQGPMIDDVFLSRYILFHLGAGAIRQCENAIVYFNPIANFRDFYLSQRRTELECKRLDILFPEYYRKTDKYYRVKFRYSLSRLKFEQKIYFFIYVFIKHLSRYISAFEFRFKELLIFFKFPAKSSNIWPTVLSSKTSFED